MEAIGRRRWAIAEGYIPAESSFSDPALISHETACILNACEHDAHVAITLFFADREPVGPYTVRYLNRLSDALFVMARHENKRRGQPDVLWDSRA